MVWGDNNLQLRLHTSNTSVNTALLITFEQWQAVVVLSRISIARNMPVLCNHVIASFQGHYIGQTHVDMG